MATSTTTVTVEDKHFDGQRLIIIGTILVNAGDYATGGLVVDFTGVVPATGPALQVSISGVNGWLYQWVKGTTNANGKMAIFGQQPTSATAGIIPLDQIANATTFGASVTGDTIRFIATFKAPR